MSDLTPQRSPSKEDLPEDFTSPGDSDKEPSRRSGSTAKVEGSHGEIESTHDENSAEKHDDASTLSPPSSAELPPAFFPDAACTGSSIPTSSAAVFSGGQETANSQASLGHQAGKQGLDRHKEDPEILEWTPPLASAEKPERQSNGEVPTEGLATKERDEVLLQSETVQHEVGICRTAAPPEYYYDIPISEFSRESSWEKKETYKKGNLDLETKMSLLTDVTQPSHNRTTSAVIQLEVQNRKPECDYEAKAMVMLYDEKAGNILKKSKEKRRLEEKDYVKFIVDLGLHQDIEKSRSKKLQLQVKVRVDEKGTYKMYWEKLMVSCSMKR